MRFLLGLITIASFLFGIIVFAGQYRCSRTGEWCVVSPTPRSLQDDSSLVREANSEVPVISRTADKFESLDVVDEPYFFGQRNTRYVVAKSTGGEVIIDTLPGHLFGGTQYFEVGKDGGYVITASSKSNESLEVVLYFLNAGVVKRTYDLECGGRSYGPMRVANSTFDTKGRKLTLDVNVDCGAPYFLRLNGTVVNDVLNRAKLTATLSGDYFVESVVTQKEQMRQKRDVLRLAENETKFKSCLGTGPEEVRSKYPTVEEGVLYCWHYTKYPKHNYNLRSRVGGYQEIAATLVTSSEVRPLIRQEFYANDDSSLFSSGISMGSGRSFAPNTNIAIVGRLNRKGSGLPSGSKAQLLIVGIGFLHELHLHCDCDGMRIERRAYFSTETRTLELLVEADSDVVVVDGTLVTLPPAELGEGNADNDKSTPPRKALLKIAINDDGAITDVNVTRSD